MDPNRKIAKKFTKKFDDSSRRSVLNKKKRNNQIDFFFILPWAAQTTQAEEIMFQNMA